MFLGSPAAPEAWRGSRTLAVHATISSKARTPSLSGGSNAPNTPLLRGLSVWLIPFWLLGILFFLGRRCLKLGPRRPILSSIRSHHSVFLHITGAPRLPGRQSCHLPSWTRWPADRSPTESSKSLRVHLGLAQAGAWMRPPFPDKRCSLPNCLGRLFCPETAMPLVQLESVM